MYVGLLSVPSKQDSSQPLFIHCAKEGICNYILVGEVEVDNRYANTNGNTVVVGDCGNCFGESMRGDDENHNAVLRDEQARVQGIFGNYPFPLSATWKGTWKQANDLTEARFLVTACSDPRSTQLCQPISKINQPISNPNNEGQHTVLTSPFLNVKSIITITSPIHLQDTQLQPLLLIQTNKTPVHAYHKYSTKKNDSHEQFQGTEKPTSST